VDYFKVTTGTGTASFTVTPDNVAPNLDVQLRLFNSTGALLATANPTTLNATLTASLAQGTYYLEVDGVGSGTATTGYTDYASLGQYRVTGNVPTASGQPPVAVADNSAPLTGVAPHAVTFSSAGSNDPDGFITSYAWNFGNGATASGQTATHTYSAAGAYTATLTVTDNSGLTGTDSVTVVVGAPPPPVTKVVSVGNIGMNLYVYRRTYYYATAAVTIRDQDGKPVPNATVKGMWSGLVKGTYTGKTNKNGLITFSSPSTRYRGTFTFTVAAVGAKGYVYDPAKNNETSDSIATP
jgi:PKD repeat protein